MPRYTARASTTRIAEATFIAKNPEHAHEIARRYFTAERFEEAAEDFLPDLTLEPVDDSQLSLFSRSSGLAQC